MGDLLFGTAGVPHSAAKRSSEAGIERIRELGLGCMELAFVRRVGMGEATAAKVRETVERLGVRLSVHGPYYINLNAAEARKVEASRQRILKAARVGWLCGARNIVFHPAFYHDDPPEVVYERVRGHLMELVEQLREEGVDFAHMHARTGKLNSYEEFVAILSLIEEKLGRTGLEDMHIHISGIDYGPKGEKEHLNLADADLRYVELLWALRDFEAKGLVICESPDLEEDALLVKETYRRLSLRLAINHQAQKPSPLQRAAPGRFIALWPLSLTIDRRAAKRQSINMIEGDHQKSEDH